MGISALLAISQRPMSCPQCGDDCRCESSRPARARPRFRPSHGGLSAGVDDRVLLEEEGCDTSEQQFAASLEAPSSAPRFVPDPPGGRRSHAAVKESNESTPAAEPPAVEEAAVGVETENVPEAPVSEVASSPLAIQMEEGDAGMEAAPGFAETTAEVPAESPVSGWEQAADGVNLPADAPEWRQEVAARLNHYHSRRRKRPPRYPSLALKFDPPVYASSPRAAEPPRTNVYQPGSRSEAATAAVAEPESIEEPRIGTPDGTNIIEFPRPLMPPLSRPDELAEPILDLPRILDAPEAVPKQVPLGGIILEPEEAVPPSDLELPLRVAALDRRLLAAGADAMLVLGATLMFGFIVNKIAALLPSLRVLLGLGVALPAMLWAVFQYLFLVYSGATPGMRLLGLRLSDFDGHVPDRGNRRWRAMAMALSAVSLGLGFLWCLLDEDTLCWHDRITRTYLDGGGSAEEAPGTGPMFPQRFFAWLREVQAFLQRREQETSDQFESQEH